MCKKKQKIPRHILIKKEPAKTQKKLSLVQQKSNKKKKRKKERGRERGEEKKTDIKHKFADKQSELKWTINSEFHGTQFDK